MERKGTGKLRVINDQKVFDYFINEEIGTKKEIAQKTNVSIMTTGTILNDFLSKGIIVENELIYVEKGRPTHQYKLNPDYYHECMMYVKKNDCCSIIYCLKNALGELIDSKKIKKKELVGEDIVNCLNKIIEEDKYLQYISLGLPAIISNNQVIESDIDSLKEILLMNDIKCIAYGYNQMHHQNVCFLTFPKDSGPGCGMILDNQLIDGNNGIAGEVAYGPLFDFLKKREFGNSLENIIQVVATTIVMYNPHLLIFTGENIKEDDLEAIQKGCPNYVPIHFMPSLKYQENCEDYYFQGLESQIIQRIQL
ncbi:ROK family protein [Faecalibacillus intestinalis]|uniref:ROK family protein n=1 Tax=Faecalibacillus intestinalis TaxID=1982626 RepID=UPI0032662965